MKKSFPLNLNGMYIPQCCFKTGYYKNSGALAITICRRTTLGVLPVIPLTINLGPMKNHCTAIKDITSPDYKLTKQMQRIGLVKKKLTTITLGYTSYPICEIDEQTLTKYAA